LWEPVVDLSGDVAFEAGDRFSLGLAVGETALQVAAGVGVVGEPADHDPRQRRVGLVVAGAAESVSVLLAG
jgi:hypothetical protein